MESKDYWSQQRKSFGLNFPGILKILAFIVFNFKGGKNASLFILFSLPMPVVELLAFELSSKLKLQYNLSCRAVSGAKRKQF